MPSEIVPTVLVALLALTLTSPAQSFRDPQTKLTDPFKTGNFGYLQRKMLGDPADIRFDERVIVQAPEVAEDSFQVPVLVDASAIPDVKRIVMFVDYGPIPKILTYWPSQATAKLAFRFKIDQATPIRAAVETHNGSWHVGHTYIDAAGGGCTAPADAYTDEDWEQHLGNVNGLLWPDRGRMRVVIDHPMDTGLADGIPLFILETLHVSDMRGHSLARLELHEPVSEDPALTLYFPLGLLKDRVQLDGRDNNGNEVHAIVGARLLQ